MNTDLRIIKTKKAIWDAFMKLISTKDYNDITVTLLAKEANISRKTFYTYYSSIGDLADYYIQYASEQILTTIRKQNFQEIFHHPEQMLDAILTLLAQRNQLIQNILFFDEYNVFLHKVERKIINGLIPIIQEAYPNINTDNAKLASSFLVLNLLSMLNFHFNGEKIENIPEHFKNQLIQLNLYGLNGLINN